MVSSKEIHEAKITVEGIILRNSITFEALIATKNFKLAWESKSPVILNYICLNINKVFEYALQLSRNTALSVSMICLSILQSTDQTILSAYFNNEQFFNFITNFPNIMDHYSTKSQALYFETVAFFIVHSGYNFFMHIDSSAYFSIIIYKLYFECSNRFLTSMLSALNTTSLQIIENAQICFLLIQEYLKNTKSAHIALNLIQTCLVNDLFASHVSMTLRNNAILRELRKHIFQIGDPKGIDFLNFLLNTAESHLYDAQWIKIANELNMDYLYICNQLIYSTSFSIIMNSLGKYFITLCKAFRHSGEEVGAVVEKAIFYLFELPFNSFAHNFAVRSIEVFIENNGNVSALIEQTQIVKKIIAIYLKKSSSNAVYWGQLLIISEELSPWVDIQKYPNWDSVVVSHNNILQKVVSFDMKVHPNQQVAPKIPWSCNWTKMPKKKKLLLSGGFFALALCILVGLLF